MWLQTINVAGMLPGLFLLFVYFVCLFVCFWGWGGGFSNFVGLSSYFTIFCGDHFQTAV